MLAPGMIPAFPLPVVGINYNFRCEAVTNCNVGRLGWNKFIEICLGIGSVEFKRMAANYAGRWDLVQLRCSNFMSCTLAERLALILLELSDNFWVRDTEGVHLTIPAGIRIWLNWQVPRDTAGSWRGQSFNHRL